MKKSKMNIKITLAVIITGVITVFINIFTTSISYAQADFGLVAFPARQEIVVEPGEKKTIAVAFYNQTLFPANGNLGVVDFIVKDSEGNPFFIENQKTPSSFSAASWLKLPYQKMTVPSRDKVIVYITVNVPKDASPGGHYTAVYFEGTPQVPSASSEKEGSAVIAPRISALLYFRVRGNIQEKATISKFFAKSFQEYGPINVDISVLNQGNIHISPKGTIQIVDIFGQVVDQQKLQTKNIFPGIIADYKHELGKKWLLGRYKVVFKAGYGAGGALTAEKYVYVLPYRIIVISALFLFILLYLLRRFYQETIARQKVLEQKIAKETKMIEELKKQLENKNK